MYIGIAGLLLAVIGLAERRSHDSPRNQTVWPGGGCGKRS